jgi:hypothetical protein
MPQGYHHTTRDIRVRHDVTIQTVATDSHLYATYYCSVSSSLSEHAIRVIWWCEASETM